jgi:hypothetical protein
MLFAHCDSLSVDHHSSLPSLTDQNENFWVRVLYLGSIAVYALKTLIANLLATKGLSRLRAGLRAQIKGLTIIIDLICNLLVSPQSHLVATLFNILVL